MTRRLLVLDASQIQAALAIVEGNSVLTSCEGGMNVAHSESLLPLVDDLLSKASLKLSQLDGFAVGVGPGSFTGLRIGCATIKALAQVLKIPIKPFSSLRALALSDQPSTIAMANAYQGQVFIGWQDSSSKVWREDVRAAEEWTKVFLKDFAPDFPRSIRFCGAGAVLYWPKIQAAAVEVGFPTEKLTLIDSIPYVTAEGAAKAAAETEKTLNYLELHANYMRPSQAEIKLDAAVAK